MFSIIRGLILNFKCTFFERLPSERSFLEVTVVCNGINAGGNVNCGPIFFKWHQNAPGIPFNLPIRLPPGQNALSIWFTEAFHRHFASECPRTLVQGHLRAKVPPLLKICQKWGIAWISLHSWHADCSSNTLPQYKRQTQYVKQYYSYIHTCILKYKIPT